MAATLVDDITPPRARTAERRGRRQRLTTMAAPVLHGQPRRCVASLNILDEAALAALEAQADWLLREIGIEFRGDDVALRLFREAGASVEGTRVRFDPGHARALCALAPETFRLHGRNPASSVTLGGDHIVLMPGYGSPFVTDLERGRRYAALADFENFVKLTYASPHLHHSGGTVCEPVDIPVNKRHLDMVYAHLRWSTKPFMGSVTAPERVRDSIDMARIAFGPCFVAQHAVIQGNINVNSPMVYDGIMSAALREYAAAGQCVCISPAVFGGAMGPVTPAAVVAQTHAEIMAGITLAQLVRPGTPVIYGSFHTTMNLRSGSLAFGSPESSLVSLALGQLARRLGVPHRASGGQVTAANAADFQAGQDSADGMWAAMLAGSHQIWHAAGWLEGGLTMGYEKFVLDLDHCGAMLCLASGLNVTDETLARDAYAEAGPGEAFLSTAHTMRHFATANFIPDLPEAGPFERWKEAGCLTAEQRALGRWKTMLAEYEAPAIDPAIDEALQDFMARRKGEMPDQWY